MAKARASPIPANRNVIIPSRVFPSELGEDWVDFQAAGSDSGSREVITGSRVMSNEPGGNGKNKTRVTQDKVRWHRKAKPGENERQNQR